jgi:hypothetical protein
VSPASQRRFHLWSVWFWGLLTIPICIAVYVFRDHELAQMAVNIWIIFVSHYAIFSTEAGAYASSSVEVRQEEK